MKTNAWVRITDSLCLEWKAWADWAQGDRTMPEPPLHEFGLEVMYHTVDWRFACDAYRIALIDTVNWRMGSVHGLTSERLQEGYTVYPGQWEVIGEWTWTPGDDQCARVPGARWAPDEALLFMPDECADPPDCTNLVPATKLRDVSLLAGQPPRELN